MFPDAGIQRPGKLVHWHRGTDGVVFDSVERHQHLHPEQKEKSVKQLFIQSINLSIIQ
jgi:hypothetical protein